MEEGGERCGVLRLSGLGRMSRDVRAAGALYKLVASTSLYLLLLWNARLRVDHTLCPSFISYLHLSPSFTASPYLSLSTHFFPILVLIPLRMS
jgi:hypothetical protein